MPKLQYVSPLDKHTDAKHSVTKFVKKIYEKIVKDSLISKMEHQFSPFISAYRKSCSTEQVLYLIWLLDDRRKKLEIMYVSF